MTDEVGGALSRLLVALLAGLLIGLDRERAEVRKQHEFFAGVRTFPLIALAGCVPMLLIAQAGALLLVASFAAVAAVTVVSYHRSSAAGDRGATTEIAAIGTFLLGALAGAGQLLVAAAASVAVAVLLTAKPRLEAFSRAITGEEMAAVLELAVITVIVLPLLPNRGYGPWEVLNPRDIWMVVVLVAGLSFAGFVSVRLLGERRGLAMTGALGGLVSSTAVTMAMAERSREGGEAARPAAAAAVLASSVMCGRVIVIAGVVNSAILPRLVPALFVMALVGVVSARLIAGAGGGPSAPAGSRLMNPFSLRAALVFAVVYALVLLVVRTATERYGSGGMLVAAGLSAVADVDAVTIAFSRITIGSAAWPVPAAAVTVAAVTNTIVKLAIGLARGRGAFRRHIAWALAAMAASGAAAGLVVYARG